MEKKYWYLKIYKENENKRNGNSYIETIGGQAYTDLTVLVMINFGTGNNGFHFTQHPVHATNLVEDEVKKG